MSIGAGCYACYWVTFALAAYNLAGQSTQNGCNASGPRVPCGEYDIKMLDTWGCVPYALPDEPLIRSSESCYDEFMSLFASDR